MESCAMSDPELIIKVWPPSITARGAKAIEAIRKPVAFSLYARPVVPIVLVLIALWGGHEYLPILLRWIRIW
jgi:hypothetical protein